MSEITILAIVGLLGLLWLKFKSYFLGKKVNSEKTELQEKKNEAIKKVAIAESINDEFQRKLREYKSKKSGK